jgi:CRP-like cAMP-binding protein
MSIARIELLQQMPIFGGVSEPTLRRLQQRAQTVSLPPGHCFFEEGDLADCLYVLEAGQAVVLKQWEGHVYRLNELQPGDCFGEMAILDMTPRSAAVEAVEDCRAISLSTGDLYELYEHDPGQYLLILMNMAREISRRLRRADERLFLAGIVERRVEHGAEHYLV